MDKWHKKPNIVMICILVMPMIAYVIVDDRMLKESCRQETIISNHSSSKTQDSNDIWPDKKICSEKNIELCLNASMKQAEFAFNSFDTRRQYEWQVTFAFWTALLISTRFLSEKGESFPFLAGVLVILAHGYWERGVWLVNGNDKRIADTFRRYAYDYIKNPSKPLPEFPKKWDSSDCGYWTGWLDWAQSFQWGVTIAIVGSAYFYLKKNRKSV